MLLLYEYRIVPRLALPGLVRQDDIFLLYLPADSAALEGDFKAFLKRLSRGVYPLLCLNVKSDGGIVDEVHAEMLVDDLHLLLQCWHPVVIATRHRLMGNQQCDDDYGS